MLKKNPLNAPVSTAQAAAIAAVANPAIFNLTGSSMKNFIAGYGLSDAPNQGACHIAWFGDSNGLRPGGNNSYVIADRLMALLQRDGLTYNAQAQPLRPFWFPANVTNFAAVATEAGTWTTANVGPFELMGRKSGANGSTITVAHSALTGVGRLHYLQQPSGGSLNLTTQSNGAFGAFSTSGTLSFQYKDFEGGDGGITITADNGVVVMGFEQQIKVSGASTSTGIRNDRQIGVKVSRFSVSGMRTVEFVQNTAGQGSLPFLSYLKAHLAVVALMTNDGNQQTSIATYTANLTTIATALKAVGTDVLFVGAPCYASDASNTIKLADYEAATRSVCTAQNCAAFFPSSSFVNWSSALALGLVDNADSLGVHLAPGGVTLDAQSIYQVIASIR